MGKLFGTLVVLLLVAVSAFFIFSNSNSGSTVTGNVALIESQKSSDSDEIKAFVLTGENFKFVRNGIDNPDLKVKQDDRVRIEFSSIQGLHDFVVDEFNAATERIGDGGGTVAVEFVADKKGIFEYYCSVDQHRANGMKGSLIVE